MGIDCRSSGFGSQSSETVTIDFHHSIVGDLGTFSGSLLFFLNSRVEVIGQLVFKWQLAACSDCLIFSFLLKGSMSDFKYTDWRFHKLWIGKDEYFSEWVRTLFRQHQRISVHLQPSRDGLGFHSRVGFWKLVWAWSCRLPQAACRRRDTASCVCWCFCRTGKLSKFIKVRLKNAWWSCLCFTEKVVSGYAGLEEIRSTWW